jgi:ethanolamine-phosphate cytidylyltransferase
LELSIRTCRLPVAAIGKQEVSHAASAACSPQICVAPPAMASDPAPAAADNMPIAVPPLYYVLDALVAARAVYGFMRAYFRAKFETQPLLPSAHTPIPAGPLSAAKEDWGGAVAETSGPRGGDAVSLPDDAAAKRPVRVYMDGCFDGMHFGHANALRQARALGDVLVVGINPEVEIRKHKGPPVMTDHERFVAVDSVKWVDEVLTDVPYEVTAEFLDKLIHEHNIDVIVHGDDPCIGADGQDVYKAVKAMGRFRTIKRTEGVSSTDIVGRMLLCTRDHHLDHLDHHDGEVRSANHVRPAEASSVNTPGTSPNSRSAPFTRVSTFLPTTRRLIQFAGGPKAPGPRDRVVYCDGTFDMFHAGHIETLRAARAEGEFLLVGIHDDATVNAHKGSNFPIMNLHERTLSVLSCKYVDEVIIGAPWCVTEDMITTMNISLVLHGTHHDPHFPAAEIDPYALPKKLGIYKEIKSTSDLTVSVILDRIVRNRDAYVERNAKKEKSETEYLMKHKVYVPEG